MGSDRLPNKRQSEEASPLSQEDVPEAQAAKQPTTGTEGGEVWPEVTYEERPWAVQEGISRSARRRVQPSYPAAIAPPIAHVPRVPLSGEVETLVAEASAEIARFDTSVGADVASFSAILLRSEAAASSKIENLTASAKAIALAEMGDPSRRNASVIVANAHAMQAALDLADRLDEVAILDMHTALLGSSRPEICGRWREQQVWIGGSDWGPFEASYVAPHHDRVPEEMHDLVGFLARDDLAPLTQAAVAHAQFETIHPFPDGNGRVGRAVIHAVLKAKGLTRHVTVPVSAGLLVNTGGYFVALDEYRQGDPGSLVHRLADASFAAIGNGRRLVSDLRELRSQWEERVRARRGATAWRLADLLLRQPVIDARSIQRELEVPAMTAHRAIDALADAGVLTKVSGNFRDRKWAAAEVLAALDEFAARAGRRGIPQ